LAKRFSGFGENDVVLRTRYSGEVHRPEHEFFLVSVDLNTD
jgi:hypothetical protein